MGHQESFSKELGPIPIAEINQHWDDTVRGLTGVGMAVVAIGAVAVTLTATASTAAISATNSTMNADGDIFKQLKTISQDTWDNTTSKESVRNIAIAAAAGGITVGLTNFVNGGLFAAPATNTTSTLSSNSSALERVSTNLKNSFQETAINTTSSAAAQSAINGDSFFDALKGQGKTILIYTAAKVGANEIGRAYHGTTDQYGNNVSEPTIGKPLQLTLHAGLGAATSALTGNNATSGALAGVIGESLGEGTNKYGNLLRSLDDVGKTAIKETTSKGSLRNIAIAAGVAGAAYGVGHWMKTEGVNPSLESGTAENSKVGVNAEYKNGVLIKTDTNISANYWTSNQNPIFQTFNTTPGSPAFADFHDAMNFPAVVNQVTIAPYYAMSQCAAVPTLCATFPDTFIKVGTWGQVNTNLDINKNNYGQQSN